MLLLLREEQQSIMIGDDIQVQISGLNGKYVLLGITAPRSIPVHRKEIYEKIYKFKRKHPDNDCLLNEKRK